MSAHACSSFVGRAEELAQLGTAYEAVCGGRTLAVLVSGEAGIGKSRLVEEFSDRARLLGGVVATGMCVPGDPPLPYAPVVGILRDLTRRVEDPAASTLLATLCGTPPDDGEPDATALTTGGFARTILFESVLQLVLHVAAAAPLVLVVEDLHWSDGASAQMIDYLVRNLGDARVLVIGTYRGEDFDADHALAGWIEELGHARSTSRLPLTGLGSGELNEILANRTGATFDALELESVWARSQGNPFFAEELVSGGAEGLPASLKTPALARIRTASAPCRQLLDVAAVAGASAEFDLLEASWPDGGNLSDVLHEAVDRRILTVDEDGTSYRFRHGLLREAVYGALPPGQRRRLHREIAVALTADERIGPKNPVHRSAAVAAHWFAAGDWESALLPSVAAADAAARVYAFPEAVAHLEHALTAIDHLGAAPQGISRLDLLERAAEYCNYRSDPWRAGELARQAVAEAMAAGNPLAAARAHLLIGQSAWGIGDSSAAFAAYRDAADVLPREATRELALVKAEEARGMMLLSRWDEAIVGCADAIAAAEAVGAKDVLGHATCTLGVCRGSLGYYEEGIALVREALEIAEDTGRPEDLNRAYANLSFLLANAGRPEDAANVALDSAAMGEQLGGTRLNSAATNSVDVLLWLGRWDEAEQILEELGMAAYGACAASPYVNRVPFALRRGRLDDAERLLSSAHRLTDGLADVQFTGITNHLDALLAVERHRPQDALEPLERVFALVRESEDEGFPAEFAAGAARAASDAALAARASGEQPVALLDLADRMYAFAEGVVHQRLARGTPLAAHVEAFMAQAHAERSRLERSDPDLWRAAGDAFDAIPDVYWAAYCRWREAEALLESRGSRARAIECLTAARTTAQRLGLVPLERSIEELALRSRIELTPPEPSADDVRAENAAALGLTAREAEILGQLTAGRSDREIAEALFISKKTVGVHVSNVLRKLQVSNRVEAGRVGQAHGLQPAGH